MENRWYPRFFGILEDTSSKYWQWGMIILLNDLE